MRALIVEDDEFKASSIQVFLASHGNFSQTEVASSLSDAIRLVRKNLYGLVVIDMAIPSHSVKPGAGSPVSFLTGGLDVLMELNALGREDPCVIVTQYHDIEIEGFFFLLKRPRKKFMRGWGVMFLSVLNIPKVVMNGSFV